MACTLKLAFVLLLCMAAMTAPVTQALVVCAELTTNCSASLTSNSTTPTAECCRVLAAVEAGEVGAACNCVGQIAAGSTNNVSVNARVDDLLQFCISIGIEVGVNLDCPN